ncbi:unnamed protein product [Gongylonema pulchrum]|uniref:CDT1 domain-containing protein n=1 Tax=Gongylonema pulchrum TaxID=637853 RepID=A0A183EY02_9BILA|nr:unnamed protein product [Gongylonema pulchrum]
MPHEFTDAQLTREKHEFFRNHLSLIPVHSNHASLSLSATTPASIALPSDFFITPFLQQQRYPESEPGSPAEHTAAFRFKFPAIAGSGSRDSSDSRRSQIQLRKHSVFDDKIDLLYKSPFVTPADPKVAGAAVMADQAGKMERPKAKFSDEEFQIRAAFLCKELSKRLTQVIEITYFNLSISATKAEPPRKCF